MGVSTYGFGGSDPATSKDQGGYSPSSPSGGVKSSEGEAEDYLWHTIDGRTDDHTGNVRGQSPVSGLTDGGSTNSNWEQTSVLGDEISYVGNNASVPNPGQTGNTLSSSWPIQYEPHPDTGIVSRRLSSRPSDDSWNCDADVGSAASCNG